MKGVSVNENLSDVGRLAQLLLNLVRSDVLTLGKLENVLLTIYDLKGTVGKEGTDVTGVNPTLGINGLLGLFWMTEITLEVVVTLVANLASRSRVSIFILIF